MRAADARPGQADASKPIALAAQRARVLLAEDNPINQEIARAVLVAAGHMVDVVDDGAQAVAAVQREAYDLILMDVQMPVMDGLTACERIRGLFGPLGQVPIVALTANVLPHQVEQFRAAGMNDHVGKPFKRETLLAVIDRVLGQFRPTSQSAA
ncbi:MAG TPA: response regulator [Microvirga sp.]|nr:response regulator [Microvirga sp.]